MTDAALLTLAGLCLGIGLSGLLAVVLQRAGGPERLSLSVVYIAFMGLIALPVVRTFASGAYIYYMPLLLVLLLVLPPALYHFVLAKTAKSTQIQIPWRDLVLPLVGGVVCVGYWTLSAQAKEVMFVEGELPPGLLPAALALVTFALILIWLIASFAYLVAILRRLTRYRVEIRHLYSDADARDLRWVDVVIVVLVLIWAVGAFSLAEDNLSSGTLFAREAFLVLIAVGLAVLNIFAPYTPPDPDEGGEEEEPDPKYARSALTQDHAAKLADRIETAMQKETLYLDRRAVADRGVEADDRRW